MRAARRTASSDPLGAARPGPPAVAWRRRPVRDHGDPTTSSPSASAADDADESSGVAPVDWSGWYLAAASIFTLVAVVGAVLLFVTELDTLGTVLLVAGDALVIITWVDYLRRP